MRRNPISPFAAALALAFLATAGCSGRKDFTPETFQTVTPGMTEEQVIDILGKPSETMEAGGTRRLFWESKGNYYSISFGGGKVIAPLAHANKDDYQTMKALMLAASKLGKDGGDQRPEAKAPTGTPSGPSPNRSSGGDQRPEVKGPPARHTLDTGLERGLMGLSISDDGKIVLGQASGAKGNVQIWDLAKKERRFAIDNNCTFVLPTALSPDGKTAAFSTQNSSIRLVDVDTGKDLRQLVKKTGYAVAYMHGIFFSPKGDLLVGVTGQEVIGWDPNTGEQRFAWQDDQEIAAVSNFFDGGRRIATGYTSKNNLIKIWDVAAGKPVQSLTSDGSREDQAGSIAVSNDARRLAVKRTFGSVQIWDIAGGKVVAESEEGIKPGLWSNIRFLPDNMTVIFGGGPRMGDKRDRIYLMSAETGKVTLSLTGHTNNVTSVAVTPDGATLVSASEDKTIKVWDLTGTR
jgi:WD40 repeat protein